MINTLFDYVDIAVAVGREGIMPNEFTGSRRDDTDTNIRTSDLPIMLATHAVGWSNGGVKRPHVPSRISVPKAMMQEGQPALDFPALRLAQMALPCENYSEETVEHMADMCRVRKLTIGGNRDVLIARLEADDLRILSAGERGTPEQGN